ncbi:MAG: hypothetical protein PQJ50_12825 [Spirochaetales bacterium]|nr:hypothetical protein [Spirochaetales bacterium]
MAKIIDFKEALEKQAADHMNEMKKFMERNCYQPPLFDEEERDEYYYPLMKGAWHRRLEGASIEQEAMMPLVELFHDLQKIVWSKGINSLSRVEGIMNCEHEDLGDFLKHVMDGDSPMTMEPFMTEVIDEGPYEDEELLDMIVIRCGCLFLADRINPLQAYNRLKGLVDLAI